MNDLTIGVEMSKGFGYPREARISLTLSPVDRVKLLLMEWTVEALTWTCKEQGRPRAQK